MLKLMSMVLLVLLVLLVAAVLLLFDVEVNVNGVVGVVGGSSAVVA
jgi:hypothetical protein